MLPKYIGFAGFGEVGKSEASKILRAEFGFEILHVKDFLAESVEPILLRLGVPQHQLRSHTHGDKINDPLPKAPHLTARILLRAQGGEFLQATDEDLMSKFWLDEANDLGGVIVAESIRYARECAYYRKAGMHVIRLTRPGKTGLSTHMSETDQSFPVDATIANDGTLDDLRQKLVDHVRKVFTTKTLVVIINGPSRSGKDSFVQAVQKYAVPYTRDLKIHNVSSVDVLRTMLTAANVDVVNKTPALRRAMARMGDVLEEELELKTSSVVDKIKSTQSVMLQDHIVFVHIREPHMIHKLEERVAELGVFFTKLYIHRERQEAVSVANDDVSPFSIGYDFIMNNNSDLNNLESMAIAFVGFAHDLLDGHQPNKQIYVSNGTIHHVTSDEHLITLLRR